MLAWKSGFWIRAHWSIQEVPGQVNKNIPMSQLSGCVAPTVLALHHLHYLIKARSGKQDRIIIVLTCKGVPSIFCTEEGCLKQHCIEYMLHSNSSATRWPTYTADSDLAKETPHMTNCQHIWGKIYIFYPAVAHPLVQDWNLFPRLHVTPPHQTLFQENIFDFYVNKICLSTTRIRDSPEPLKYFFLLLPTFVWVIPHWIPPGSMSVMGQSAAPGSIATRRSLTSRRGP